MCYFPKEELHLFRFPYCLWTFFFWRFSPVLMALCAISQRKNFTFLGFHIVFASVRFIASTFSPMSIIKDFVEKTPFALGSQVSESSLFDNTTGARSRLNSAHSVASLSFKFLPSFKFQNLSTTFHVFLIVAFFLWESLYKSGYFKVSVVFSIHGSLQNDVLPPLPTLWRVRLVMKFWCSFMYFQGPFVEDGGVIFVWCKSIFSLYKISP